MHKASLEDALKYEGDTMGHCVGGYCPDVIEGKSRIFSLRSGKGEPHVTIEATPTRLQDWTAKTPDPDNPARTLRDRINAERSGDGDFESFGRALVQKLGLEPPLSIKQIKGKANRAPNEEYLPFVQDFVKSGTWSDVGDFSNTGLIKIDASSDLAKNLKDFGRDVPPYVNQDDLTKLLDWSSGRRKDLPEGFAAGGIVAAPDSGYNAERVEEILSQLRAEML
jgi:hypothetical protein